MKVLYKTLVNQLDWSKFTYTLCVHQQTYSANKIVGFECMVNFSIIEFILKVQEFGQWNISIIKHFCFYNISTEENTKYSTPQIV